MVQQRKSQSSRNASWWPRQLIAPLFAFALSTAAVGFEPPKPNPYLEKQLAEQGISHQEWLLFDGIRKSNLEQVAYALAQGANPNEARDTIGPLPPLIAAVSQYLPNEAIIALLLDKGADVNRRFTPKPVKPAEDGFWSRMHATAVNQNLIGERTPLHFAAMYGTPEAVTLVVRRGAEVDARNSRGETPLFDVPSNKRENADALLQAGAKINAKDKSGETVLWRKKSSLQNVRDQTPAQKQALSAYIEWLTSNGAIE
jgi:hypothetical protein